MEENYKNILVPVDGSLNSNRVLDRVAIIGKQNNASLDIIYVAGKLSFNSHITMITQLMHETRRLSADILRNAERQLPEDIEARFHLIYGDPKEAIVKISKKETMDLIVMGATGKGAIECGKGAIERAIVGSTTAYVVNHAPCNVLVVR